jgi:aquaporin Z
MDLCGVQLTETSEITAVAKSIDHWPEYLIEAASLGCFMLSACIFGVLLEHPGSVVHQAIENPAARRALMGIAMGLTAIIIICSPWGQRSGAHMNPAVTITFLALGKVRFWDAVFYVASQFLGGLAGVLVADVLIGYPLSVTGLNYVSTMPGDTGPVIAFAAELLISFVLMFTVLTVSNSQRWSRRTPLFAGSLIALYITLEAPLSGMSMNPARTFASAVFAQDFSNLWIYFVAPVAGMLLAGFLFRSVHGKHAVLCAKLNHYSLARCIFRCEFKWRGDYAS